MKQNYDLSIWGDNWWIEKDKAWFVCGRYNLICCLDLKTKLCELVVYIPDTSHSKFRINSFCMKYQEELYCMPIKGKSIWIYNTVKLKFYEICIDCPNETLLNIRDFWVFDNKIYAVSNGLRQILEINPVKKKIENRYSLCNKGDIAKSIKDGSQIYSLCGEYGQIYQFDLVTKEIMAYKIGDRKFNTLCFDGERFWLSGNNKKLYVWNKEKNKIKILNNFPTQFGMYDFSKNSTGKVNNILDEYKFPIFLYSIVVGKSVWFIPYLTNKIIYIDQESFVLQVFEIEEENETKESILERTDLCYKYLFEYVKDNRYIGLFSIKNNCILEIDTFEQRYKYKQYDYCMSEACIEEYVKCYGNIFYECNLRDIEIYTILLKQKRIYTPEKNIKSVGSDICKTII